MSTLERAIAFAAQAHAGQLDKAGAPYILHPLRVMLAMKSDPERIVAVLHDVVEDTDWTLSDLDAESFSQEVLDAVDSVTRRKDESYRDFIIRAGHNVIGRRVKIADIMDNLEESRFPDGPPPEWYKHRDRYKDALFLLMSTSP